MIITEETPPRLEGTGVSVVDVYAAYARDGYEPAEISAAFSIPLADVHEAIAHYYRHSDDLKHLDAEYSVEQAESRLSSKPETRNQPKPDRVLTSSSEALAEVAQRCGMSIDELIELRKEMGLSTDEAHEIER